MCNEGELTEPFLRSPLSPLRVLICFDNLETPKYSRVISTARGIWLTNAVFNKGLHKPQTHFRHIWEKEPWFWYYTEMSGRETRLGESPGRLWPSSQKYVVQGQKHCSYYFKKCIYIYTDTLKCTLKHTHTNTQRLTVTSTSSHSGPPSHIVIRNSMLTSFPCLRLWDCFMAITSNHKAWLWPWEWLSHWATVHTIPPVTMKRGHKTPLKLMIMYETCSPWQSPLVSNPPPPFLAPLLRVMDFMKWCLTEFTKFN